MHSNQKEMLPSTKVKKKYLTIKAMTKGIAIIGKSASWKRLQAEKATIEYLKEEVVPIDFKKFKPNNYHFMFQKCDHNTKAIIIEGISADTDIGVFKHMITESVIIDKQSRDPFPHKFEKVILIFDEEVTRRNLQGASFIRRFEIVEIIET
jgi:hypothetical protein